MEEEMGALPERNDFSAWYNELLWRAEIMDVRYPVKGIYVWYPFGFSLRRNVYDQLRAIMDREHQEALFPLLIPETEFAKEAEHIKGFEEEVYWVTHGGLTPLDVKLALRPTSECAIYPMYALWVRSHADLPLRIYQIVNTFRYETKHTRPLIRLREITSFKEAHTVHATWDDAEAQVQTAIGLYKEFYRMLCIPVIVSKRPDWDKFPGADHTIAVDAIMPDGKTLQSGTVHHLGDHFSRTFSIQYEDIQGEQQYAFQTCYGISERCIAALISVHGDDRGLVLPPRVAPTQVVLVPITIGKRKDEVANAAKEIEERLLAAGFRVKRDDRDLRPGAKVLLLGDAWGSPPAGSRPQGHRRRTGDVGHQAGAQVRDRHGRSRRRGHREAGDLHRGARGAGTRAVQVKDHHRERDPGDGKSAGERRGRRTLVWGTWVCGCHRGTDRSQRVRYRGPV